MGIEMALGRPVDIAINHDPDAILMHKTNHPDTLHLTEDIFKVDLKKVCERSPCFPDVGVAGLYEPQQGERREATGKRPEDPSVGCVQACEGYPAGCDPDGECGRNTAVGTVRCRRISDQRAPRRRLSEVYNSHEEPRLYI